MHRLLTLIFLLGSTAYANVPIFTVGTDPLLNIQNTGTALNLRDDQMSGMKDLGFSFTHYGNDYTQANIAMNGFLTFNPNFSVNNYRNYMSETLPATGFNFSIMPLWTDLINNGTNNPYIQTFGETSATDQYFVVGWYNAQEYGVSGNLNSFEAILYETSNAVEFRYDKIDVSNHNITIGLQGNNEAVTYLRYQDTNSTSYVLADDWSISTAIDESFTNLSSECLINSDFSELCNVYDLSFDVEDEEEHYLQGSGVSEAMLLGYDNEEEFYGFNVEETYTGTSTVSTDADIRVGGGNEYDGAISISHFEFDIGAIEDNENNLDNFDISTDRNFSLGGDEETLMLIDFELGSPEDLLTLPNLDDLITIRMTEEEFVELAQHFDEHFDHEDEMDREAWDEQFEDFETEEEEEFTETQEAYEEREEREEEIEELEEEFEEREEEREELQEEEELNEEAEETPERSERRARRRNVVTSINFTDTVTNSTISNSVANTSTSSTSNSSNATTSAVSSGSGAVSVSNSPSISAQISSARVQTNTILQSIEILPMPTMDNTPSMVMAEVQVTTMDNQIESVTSTMVTSSEAEEIAEEIVANNIRVQQETSQTQQEESGQYDSQGQSTLIAYMNYVPNFSDYTTANITDQTNWYAPTAIYTSATLGDNAGYGNMVSNSLDTLYSIMGQQPVGIFIDRR
jgi:hypothetical protein